MSLLKKLRGTMETIFRLGLAGPQFKKNGNHIDFRNADDTGFVNARVAAPATDNDVVNLKYFKSFKGTVIISRQADCSSAIPNNTSSSGFVVVTTAGSGAVVGDLLYDDGSNTGTMEIIVAVEGRTLAITDALSGGTATFEADSLYVWDDDGSTWVKVGDIGSTTGAIREIRYAITNAATQDSANQIPANARITECSVEITTPYSGGATISVGRAGSTSLLQTTSDNLPQTADTYSVDQDTAWGGSALVVRTTVGGSPGAGAGIVIVKYSVPNN